MNIYLLQQDFVLNSLLETLGKEARIEALSPLGHPQYNALILIELWNIEGSPKVKVPFSSSSSF